jgi:hypothetical protein
LSRFARRTILLAAVAFLGAAVVRASALRTSPVEIAWVAVQIAASDLYDVFAVVAPVFGILIGAAGRSTQYALICEQPGAQTEADNAVNEKQVRNQLGYQSGEIYNTMRANIRDGHPHPIFILSKNAQGGAIVCASSDLQHQDCTCQGRYKAIERARIPAKDLFGPPQRFN